MDGPPAAPEPLVAGFLVVFGGLPGVGKSTLARALALRLDAVYVRIDSIEDAIGSHRLAPPDLEDLGYRAAYALALDNLALGRIVVADSVNPVEETRLAWRRLAQAGPHGLLEVEVRCSDVAEHRRRVESRRNHHPVGGHPAWDQVLARRFDVWPEALVLDTARQEDERAVRWLIAAISERIAFAPESDES